MPLKRGRVRESCQFCYGRKIKCDRGAMRVACSACVRRDQQCHLMTEDTLTGRTASQTVVQPAKSKGKYLESRRYRQGHQDVPGSRQFPVSPSSPTQSLSAQGQADASNSKGSETCLQTIEPYQPFAISASQSLSGTRKATAEGSETISDDLDHSTYDPFAFSDQSFSYLDQLFIGDCESLSWVDEMFVFGQVGEPTASCKLNLTTSIDAETLLAACRSYFEVAGPALPVLSEEYFWLDVNNGSCAQTLLCAVACRGIIYLPIERKGELQQQLAREFRDLFIQKQQVSGLSGPVCIEDLQALALMMDFPYEDGEEETMLRHLGSMYLTHDTLVLLTLQAGREVMDKAGRDKDDSGSLLDRCSYFLLFWHVYGLDAFHCLDKQRLSRIQDEDATPFESLQSMRLESFLDAILSLARLARLISHYIPKIKPGRINHNRQGVIEMLYHELGEWDAHHLPAALRWPAEPAQRTVRRNTQKDAAPAVDGELTQMHRLVIAVLKLNCYMQIERYAVPTRQERMASDIGDGIVSARVECETLRQIQKVFVNSAWLRVLAQHEGQPGSFSPFDRFSPMRDMCRGLCNWLTLRERSCGRSIDLTTVKNFSSELSGLVTGPEKLNNASVLIASLRHAVASASSHSDTEGMLEEIDRGLNLT